MRVLAIESATDRPSVALVEGERVVAMREAGRDATRSETLLPAVEAVLAARGLTLADLDGFAIGIGPGSFTGLRVGLATLKGLAFGDARPAVAVPTLTAVARQAGEPRPEPVVAALDARRGEVYAAVFPAGRETQARVPAGLHRPETLAELLTAEVRAGLLVGDGAPLLGAHLGPGFRALAPEPAAGHVGVLGARGLAAGQGGPAAALVPCYVRRAQAEVARTGRSVEGGARRGPGLL